MIIPTGKNQSTRREISPSATACTANLTGSNQVLRGERPATVRLSRGTACKPVNNTCAPVVSAYLTGNTALFLMLFKEVIVVYCENYERDIP
jgi:hypothetical protein